ncbi:naked cuticle-like protein 3 [Silurus asotus]|uniref:Protein naked cuticle homolog n=1 Tax=Silurus asotus TaxID=30991 RepID=A0AAD5ATZ5_SILAS|nr:naked cuticle-like protein 3 [Silurus asotus]
MKPTLQKLVKKHFRKSGRARYINKGVVDGIGVQKLQAACKRRESPEGGILATGSFLLQGESTHLSESDRIRNKQLSLEPLSQCEMHMAGSQKSKALECSFNAHLGMCGTELREDHFLDHDCPLEVFLPPERAAEFQSYKVSPENGDPSRRNAKNDHIECNVPTVDENQQEWVFTLYDFDNSGKVTKEDMSSLMHTIYEVVEASVKQSALCDSKTLRVKLTVTPSISSSKRGEYPAISSEKKTYRIDENTERRNHYLDLAGIENYTSRFDADNTFQLPYEDQCQDSPAHGSRSTHQRWSQLERGSLGKAGDRRLPFLRSLRSRSKSNRLHGHHPVSWCCPPAIQQQQQQPLYYSHSKRVHGRPRDATSASMPYPRLDLELQPGTGISPGGFMPMAQRHEHHHLHEHHHHHHHHHHHYYSS